MNQPVYEPLVSVVNSEYVPAVLIPNVELRVIVLSELTNQPTPAPLVEASSVERTNCPKYL